MRPSRVLLRAVILMEQRGQVGVRKSPLVANLSSASAFSGSSAASFPAPPLEVLEQLAGPFAGVQPLEPGGLAGLAARPRGAAYERYEGCRHSRGPGERQKNRRERSPHDLERQVSFLSFHPRC